MKRKEHKSKTCRIDGESLNRKWACLISDLFQQLLTQHQQFKQQNGDPQHQHLHQHQQQQQHQYNPIAPRPPHPMAANNQRRSLQ